MSYRTPREIVRAAMRVTGSSEAFILSHNRYVEATEIRHAICIVGRWRGFSYPQIGRSINRDHSTVFAHVLRHSRTRRVVQLAVKIDLYLRRKPTWRDRMREAAHAGPPA